MKQVVNQPLNPNVFQKELFAKNVTTQIIIGKKRENNGSLKDCSYRTTLKNGTVMEKSKLPYQYWFVAMHLLTSTKKIFSAKEIQRQLGHNRYQPIWEILHKTRSVLVLRDDKYILRNEAELDDGFFETVSINRNKKEALKRGRGSQKQTTVLVSKESDTIKDDSILKKYSKKKRLGFIKMKVITSLKIEVVIPVIKSMVKKGSVIVSDGATSFNGIKNDYLHSGKVIPKKEISKFSPWVHTVISNIKRMLLDIHHSVDDDFLQNHLNEYVYKLNRRNFKCGFERLLITDGILLGKDAGKHKKSIQTKISLFQKHKRIIKKKGISKLRYPYKYAIILF